MEYAYYLMAKDAGINMAPSELMTIARTLGLPRVDAIEIFRRMVFNVIARNQDDHTKNFGFLLDHSAAGWRLAPAFDIAYSYKPSSYWVDTHQMTINSKRDKFTRGDIPLVQPDRNPATTTNYLPSPANAISPSAAPNSSCPA